MLSLCLCGFSPNDMLFRLIGGPKFSPAIIYISYNEIRFLGPIVGIRVIVRIT